MNTLLSVNNLTYSVKQGGSFLQGKKEKIILHELSFKLEKGKILGVAGESGSGKTTLAKLIAGIIQPSSGKIELNFNNVRKETRTSPVQILFQNNGEILNPFREIDKIVEEALIIKNNSDINVQEEKAEIFNSIDFPEDLWRKKGYQLSGGEQQRAALARLLAAKPELLILDEPFSAQDPASQLNLLNLFKKINDDFEITMICIAHNLQLLNKLCNEIIIMYKGEIVETGNAKDIFNSPQHDYTKFLIKAGNYNLSSAEIKNEIEHLSKS